MLKKTIIIFSFLCLSVSHAFSLRRHDNFIVHAIPKCGVNLSHKLFPMLFNKPLKCGPLEHENIINSIKQHYLIRSSRRLDQQFVDAVDRNKFKMVCVIRDPRDALVSLAIYMRKFKNGRTKRDFVTVPANFNQLTLDEQIICLLTNPDWNYHKLYTDRILWSFRPNSLMIKYENLIGSQGGGDDTIQIQELLKIVNFVNCAIPHEKIIAVANDLYSCWGQREVEDKTFTHGQIGSWKYILNDEHKQMIKKSWGDLLIQLGYEEDYSW